MSPQKVICSCSVHQPKQVRPKVLSKLSTQHYPGSFLRLILGNKTTYSTDIISDSSFRTVFLESLNAPQPWNAKVEHSLPRVDLGNLPFHRQHERVPHCGVQNYGFISQIYVFICCSDGFQRFTLEVCRTGKEINVPFKLPTILFEIHPPSARQPSKI